MIPLAADLSKRIPTTSRIFGLIKVFSVKIERENSTPARQVAKNGSGEAARLGQAGQEGREDIPSLRHQRSSTSWDAASSGQSVIVTRLERPSKLRTQFRRMSLPIKIA